MDAGTATRSLARTRGHSEHGQQPVTEIRAWYLDLIGRARTRIFIENQYFSSAAVTDAIVGRIRGIPMDTV